MKTATFDGETFIEERDHNRLAKQLNDVKAIMLDGKMHFLKELAMLTGHPEASCSSRLRDLRKDKFGSWVIERTYIERGLFGYTMKALPMPATD